MANIAGLLAARDPHTAPLLQAVAGASLAVEPSVPNLAARSGPTLETPGDGIGGVSYAGVSVSAMCEKLMQGWNADEIGAAVAKMERQFAARPSIEGARNA